MFGATTEKDRKEVSSSWPPIVPGRASFERHNSMAPFASPENQEKNHARRLRESDVALSLKHYPPRVVIDNATDPTATLVKVDSINRQGCLLEVVQVLTDLDLIITKAHISSDGGWFVDVFHVTDQFGGKVVEEGLIEYIQKALGDPRDVSVQEVRTCLGRSVSVQGNGSPRTSIELNGVDRPGLLADISAVLKELQCNVLGAEVWTQDLRCACVLHVTDRTTNGEIEDPGLIAEVKARLSAVMSGPVAVPSTAPRSTSSGEQEALARSISSSSDSSSSLSGVEAELAREAGAPGLTSRIERRLHQMMMSPLPTVGGGTSAATGGPVGSNGGAGAASSSRRRSGNANVQVTVRNCGETMYTIVEVKCRDRPRLLFDTVCTLTDMSYVVFHGAIDSCDGMASQEYYIKNINGETLKTEAERERVSQALEAAIERRTPEGVRLELCSVDRPGLLSDVTRIFHSKGVSVSRADVATDGVNATDVFYVTDAEGNAITDSQILDEIRAEISQAGIQFKEGSHHNGKQGWSSSLPIPGSSSANSILLSSNSSSSSPNNNAFIGGPTSQSKSQFEQWFLSIVVSLSGGQGGARGGAFSRARSGRAALTGGSARHSGRKLTAATATTGASAQ
eukprot:TRINITY_DN2110_c0_g1_i1.p1 TRINITY_DN2110_c0_g1~~TRINITY_DN2110_c0_g1_i1.p1  ORF type:complete len:624 (-),score=111.50 TRINITY_DN2110_c0_g1_i1:1605-3476(-)